MEEQSQGKQLNRRSFIQGIAATGALGIMAGAGLSGCAPQQQSAAAEAPQQEAGASAGEVHEWVNAVSSASLATNKYTTFTETQLQDAVMAYQTECVVSTSNEDGTPNIAIFVPAAMIDGTYVAFAWAENQTKANFERAKIGMIAFDVPNPTAETKELRHQGSVVKATLVEDESVIGKLKDADEQLAVCTFVEITELLPVG